ncbi:hypothetical protein TNCV_412841 [Trichonephila clavipes]|nr:hypothetical protein TNCV_412841 [Trichonephila clavipes]
MARKKKLSLQEALDLLHNLPSEISGVLTDAFSEEEVPANNLLEFSDSKKNCMKKFAVNHNAVDKGLTFSGLLYTLGLQTNTISISLDLMSHQSRGGDLGHYNKLES